MVFTKKSLDISILVQTAVLQCFHLYVSFWRLCDTNIKTYCFLSKSLYVCFCLYLSVFVLVFAKTLWQWSKADVVWFLSNARPLASKGYLFVFPHLASQHTWFTKSYGWRHPGWNCKKTLIFKSFQRLSFFFYLLDLASEHTWFKLSVGLRHHGSNCKKSEIQDQTK